MISFGDWVPALVMGTTFTALGVLKLYGWRKGIVGGGGKALSCRMLGRCPSWSRPFNILFIVVLLGVGLFNLGLLARFLIRH